MSLQDDNLIKSGGKLTWEKTYGSNGGDWASCVIQTIDDNYVVAGAIHAEGYNHNVI